MKARKKRPSYHTRPKDVLVESHVIPGIYWNMRTGLVCRKDGTLIAFNPLGVEPDKTGIATFICK